MIEFATFFGVEPGFGDNVGKFLTQAGSPTPAGYYGHAYGPSVEDDLNKHAEQEVGEGSNAIVLLIGWESKEKHMEFRETEQFKENIALLRSGAKGAEMVSLSVSVTEDERRVLMSCSSISRRLRRLIVCNKSAGCILADPRTEDLLPQNAYDGLELLLYNKVLVWSSSEIFVDCKINYHLLSVRFYKYFDYPGSCKPRSVIRILVLLFMVSNVVLIVGYTSVYTTVLYSRRSTSTNSEKEACIT